MVAGLDVRYGPGSVVFAGVVLGTNIRSAGTPTSPVRDGRPRLPIGDFVTVNPSASISGDCHIEDDVMIGAGAVILQGLTVGHGTTVGASACLVRDVGAGMTVKGVPAK